MGKSHSAVLVRSLTKKTGLGIDAVGDSLRRGVRLYNETTGDHMALVFISASDARYLHDFVMDEFHSGLLDTRNRGTDKLIEAQRELDDLERQHTAKRHYRDRLIREAVTSDTPLREVARDVNLPLLRVWSINRQHKGGLYRGPKPPEYFDLSLT